LDASKTFRINVAQSSMMDVQRAIKKMKRIVPFQISFVRLIVLNTLIFFLYSLFTIICATTRPDADECRRRRYALSFYLLTTQPEQQKVRPRWVYLCRGATCEKILSPRFGHVEGIPPSLPFSMGECLPLREGFPPVRVWCEELSS
jgi:hypothetical protein